MSKTHIVEETEIKSFAYAKTLVDQFQKVTIIKHAGSWKPVLS